MRAPSFWYSVNGKPGYLLPRLLAPFAFCYLIAGWLRQRFVHACRPPIPVICIGNLTSGGTGKTPVALALAQRLLEMGVHAHFLTRGYGGHLAGPVRVDPHLHRAGDVGDEALLLAGAAPCWVARARKAGAMAAVQAGAELLIMDDGHQNPGLHKDLSLLLIDAERGLGNGWVMPSGPLREPAAAGIARADAILIVGDGRKLPDFGKPLYQARKQFRDPAAIHGKRLYAFCGIGEPNQFFTMLRQAGGDLVDVQIFADHHPFTDDEIDRILSCAGSANAVPVTTAKDWVRLPPAARMQITAIGMEIHFSDEAAVSHLLQNVISRRP